MRKENRAIGDGKRKKCKQRKNEKEEKFHSPLQIKQNNREKEHIFSSFVQGISSKNTNSLKA